jgi:hypothetical protein
MARSVMPRAQQSEAASSDVFCVKMHVVEHKNKNSYRVFTFAVLKK